jgi:thioredoxin 1
MDRGLATFLGMATTVDAKTFEALASQPGLTVLEFSAAWCPPCKALAPVLEKATSGPGVRLAINDVDDQVDLAARFAVRAMPTVVLWRDGTEVGRFVGLRSQSFVAGVIARALAGDVAITSP